MLRPVSPVKALHQLILHCLVSVTVVRTTVVSVLEQEDRRLLQCLTRRSRSPVPMILTGMSQLTIMKCKDS